MRTNEEIRRKRREDWLEARRPQLPTYHRALNVSGKLKRISPTCVALPYDGMPADIGEPDLEAGRGCK